MPMSKEDITNTVITLIENNVPPNTEVEEYTDFGELGIDSLDAVEIIMQIEDELGLFLPDNIISDSTTVQDIIDRVCKIYKKQIG